MGEALEQQRAACLWEPTEWLRGAELVDQVRRAGKPAPHTAEDEDDEEEAEAVTW